MLHIILPYSGKVSLVQTFALSCTSITSRRNFRPFSVLRSTTQSTHILNFHCSYFRGSQPLREMRESLHQAKLSCFTVFMIHVYLLYMQSTMGASSSKAESPPIHSPGSSLSRLSQLHQANLSLDITMATWERFWLGEGNGTRREHTAGRTSEKVHTVYIVTN